MCKITPDSDISGIGVRLAIYIQALLSVIQFAALGLRLAKLPPLYSRKKDHIVEAERVLETSVSSIADLILTTTVITSTALIQFIRELISPHHALIVLNLNWILCLTAYSWVVLLYLSLDRVGPRRGIAKIKLLGTEQEIEPPQWLAVPVAFSLVLGTIFTWFYSEVPEAYDCTEHTVFWVFGFMHITERAFIWWWRAFLWAPIVILRLTVLIFRRTRPTVTPLVHMIFVSAVVCLDALLIVSTELTIRRNTGTTEAGWGFGQVVPALFIITPLRDALRSVWFIAP